MALTLKNVNIVLPHRVVFGNIDVKNGTIHAIQIISETPCEKAYYLMPGFIDTHLHGAIGVDVMDASVSALTTLSKAISEEGVTAYLATTRTASIPAIHGALISINEAMKLSQGKGARLLGAHLEGPFIETLAAGAQDKTHVLAPSIKAFEEMLEASNHTIKVMTLAPELEGAMDLIAYAVNNGVKVSLGHSLANYDTTVKAIDLGATSVTHCYNAMRPFHHREVGILGASWLHDALSTEVILDGYHVSKEAVKILYRMKTSENIRLVTDANRAKGLTDGVYNGFSVMNKKATLNDGTLAGSTLRFNEAVAYAKNTLHLPFETLAKMSSYNAARFLGIEHAYGSIEIGKHADFVLLDETCNVMMTIINGHIVYRRENHEN